MCTMYLWIASYPATCGHIVGILGESRLVEEGIKSEERLKTGKAWEHLLSG